MLKVLRSIDIDEFVVYELGNLWVSMISSAEELRGVIVLMVGFI